MQGVHGGEWKGGAEHADGDDGDAGLGYVQGQRANPGSQELDEVVVGDRAD